MKIDKSYAGLTQLTDEEYVIDGDIISEEEIEIDDFNGTLIVNGSIESKKGIISRSFIKVSECIKSGESIFVDGSIEAGFFIEASGSIESRYSVMSDGCITAGKDIKADGIFAESYIEAGGDINSGVGPIKSGSSIEAGGEIVAGSGTWRGDAIGICAGSYITAGKGIYTSSIIEAGDDVEAGGQIEAEEVRKPGL